jgi:hypothetical protein
VSGGQSISLQINSASDMYYAGKLIINCVMGSKSSSNSCSSNVIGGSCSRWNSSGNGSTGGVGSITFCP